MSTSQQGSAETGACPGKFPLVLSLAFFALVLAGLVRHEMWRDELQAWLIARDSVSVPNLLFNLRYEAHPPLWHFLLFLISRVTSNPVFMQALHLCIATASIYIFARYSPFSRLQKALFAAGYFPFYEYAVISRCYALGVLLVFVFCALFPKRGEHPLLMPLLLFLTGITSLMGAMVAMALWPLLLWEAFGERAARRSEFLIAVCLFLLACVWTLNTINVPADAYYPIGPAFTFEHFFARVRYAMLPGHYQVFALRPLFGLPADSAGLTMLYLFEIVLVSLALLRRRAALFAYLAGSGMLLFFFYTQAVYPRHRGHLYLMLIIALWLAASLGGSRIKNARLAAVSDLAARALPFWLTLLLALQVPVGLKAYWNDLRYPVSGIKAAADFIRKNGLQALPIVGDDDGKVSGITAFLDVPVYFPASASTVSYVLWNTARGFRHGPKVVLQVAGTIAAERKSPVLLVLSYALPGTQGGARPLGVFPGVLFEGETLYIYALPYTAGRKAP